jgi:hypothetical protein
MHLEIYPSPSADYFMTHFYKKYESIRKLQNEIYKQEIVTSIWQKEKN